MARELKHAESVSPELSLADVRCIYDDVGARIANDDSRTYFAISTATVALPLYANLFREFSQQGALFAWLYALSILCLLLSVIAGLISVASYRDLRDRFAYRWLLGNDGLDAVTNVRAIFWRQFGPGNLSLLHTSALMSRFNRSEGMNTFKDALLKASNPGALTQEQRSQGGGALQAFLSAAERDMRRGFTEDFLLYSVSLAHIIEIKRRPRIYCLGLLAAGVASMAVSLLLLASPAMLAPFQHALGPIFESLVRQFS
jgi:hypothetical protein